jgi:hypothetical protein
LSTVARCPSTVKCLLRARHCRSEVMLSGIKSATDRTGGTSSRIPSVAGLPSVKLRGILRRERGSVARPLHAHWRHLLTWRTRAHLSERLWGQASNLGVISSARLSTVDRCNPGRSWI